MARRQDHPEHRLAEHQIHELVEAMDQKLDVGGRPRPLRREEPEAPLAHGPRRWPWRWLLRNRANRSVTASLATVAALSGGAATTTAAATAAAARRLARCELAVEALSHDDVAPEEPHLGPVRADEHQEDGDLLGELGVDVEVGEQRGAPPAEERDPPDHRPR